jgi:hypothetical protein
MGWRMVARWWRLVELESNRRSTCTGTSARPDGSALRCAGHIVVVVIVGLDG